MVTIGMKRVKKLFSVAPVDVTGVWPDSVLITLHMQVLFRFDIYVDKPQ